MISINEICLFPYFDSSLSLFYGLKICYVRHHEMVFTSYIPLSFPIKKKKNVEWNFLDQVLERKGQYMEIVDERLFVFNKLYGLSEG